MIQKGRGKANDSFHLEIASTYARFELAAAAKRYASDPTESSRRRVERITLEMKELAPELLPH